MEKLSRSMRKIVAQRKREILKLNIIEDFKKFLQKNGILEEKMTGKTYDVFSIIQNFAETDLYSKYFRRLIRVYGKNFQDNEVEISYTDPYTKQTETYKLLKAQDQEMIYDVALNTLKDLNFEFILLVRQREVEKIANIAVVTDNDRQQEMKEKFQEYVRSKDEFK